jgi:hypothetical protein
MAWPSLSSSPIFAFFGLLSDFGFLLKTGLSPAMPELLIGKLGIVSC